MISPRRQAQCGLLAAALIFVAAFGILLAGSLETPNTRAGLPGSPAAWFRLPDLNGNMVSLSAMRGSVVVLYFAPTPESKQTKENVDRLAELGRRYCAQHDVKLVAVYSGIEDYPQGDLHVYHDLAADAGPKCMTLLDPTSHVLRRFNIQDTPTYLVIDTEGIIRYRGGIDDPSADAPLASASFTPMIDLLLAEKPLPGQPTPAVLSKIK